MESYTLSEVVERGMYQKSSENVTDTECAENSFSISFCFAATYYRETGICIAECTDMDNVPENVTLVNSTILQSTPQFFYEHTIKVCLFQRTSTISEVAKL